MNLCNLKTEKPKTTKVRGEKVKKKKKKKFKNSNSREKSDLYFIEKKQVCFSCQRRWQVVRAASQQADRCHMIYCDGGTLLNSHLIQLDETRCVDRVSAGNS